MRISRLRRLISPGLLALAVLPAVAVCLCAAAAPAAGSRTLSIDVTSRTPLASVACVLERRYGAAVTYEDPVYTAASDLAPLPGAAAAGSVERDLRPTRLALSYTVQAATGRPEDVAAVVQQALDLHAAAGNPGRFRLEREGEVVHIVPAEVRGPEGQWREVTPLLDAKPDLGNADRNLEETIALILQEVRRLTGVRVDSLQEPINLERRILFPRGAGGESARSLLTRAVGLLPVKSTWTLKYSPMVGRAAFEIHPLAQCR